jgi:hypothetical protein
MVEAQKLSIGIREEGSKRKVYSAKPRNTSTGVNPDWMKRHHWAGTLNKNRGKPAANKGAG